MLNCFCIYFLFRWDTNYIHTYTKSQGYFPHTAMTTFAYGIYIYTVFKYFDLWVKGSVSRVFWYPLFLVILTHLIHMLNCFRIYFRFLGDIRRYTKLRGVIDTAESDSAVHWHQGARLSGIIDIGESKKFSVIFLSFFSPLKRFMKFSTTTRSKKFEISVQISLRNRSHIRK